ncbi:T-box transcription factor TBX22 [Chanos chanos]|uniref:T-box transcription factor TBX22 n=1 Tax=Chanos chanos TaxID=29144 RepID=A0A6J2UQV8_CHACN|nr:T-box transcription factor TBX22 [Chanos chanos]
MKRRTLHSQSFSEDWDRCSTLCPRMQGLSSRAHAFSVEALVGKSCKRMKVENGKAERPAGNSVTEEDSDTPTSTDEKQKKNRQISERRSENESEPEKEIRVELQGSDLWNRFHEIGTEMIITKAGRRMFPSIRVKVRNLDPFKQYYIAMDIMPVDSKRYRYVYHSSQWMVAGNTDHSCIAPRLYVHPDSPCSGDTWARQIISFDRVKLTNNEMDDKGHIILQSMHKYKPRVHVIQHDSRVDLSQIQSLPAEGVYTFSFPETQFTTVTAYQNQQITKLKIDRNPFAKGFRDPGRNRGVLDGILESYPWRNPFSLDFKPFTLELQGGSSMSSANCGAVSPLKGLLPHACSASSNPFSLSSPDAGLHNLSVPLCYKVSPSVGPVTNRAYSSTGPDRLRGFAGLRPLTDLSLFSVLHGKKGGQCFQSSPCLLPLQGLQSTRASSVSHLQHDTVNAALTSPYNLYNYTLPMSPHFASVSRHSKLGDGMTLSPPESLLRQMPWTSSVDHCL